MYADESLCCKENKLNMSNNTGDADLTELTDWNLITIF